jgi:hypothetical protein
VNETGTVEGRGFVILIPVSRILNMMVSWTRDERRSKCSLNGMDIFAQRRGFHDGPRSGTDTWDEHGIQDSTRAVEVCVTANDLGIESF